MKTIRVLGLLLCVLLLTGVASARVVTVQQTIDYRNNLYPSEPWDNYTWEHYVQNSYYFWHTSLDPTIDHSPFYRNMWEDWGWAHDLTGRAPADANGIQSAVLAIHAWDVDDDEVDNVFVHNGTTWEYVGQLQGSIQTWSVTSFELSATLLQQLLSSRKLHVSMDIDYGEMGCRVALASSVLDVTYTVTGEAAEPDVFVYRFWSGSQASHFYTVSEEERDYVIATWPDKYTYEGIAYRAFGDALDSNLRPVYRFWSALYGGHFYTIDEAQRDYVIATWPTEWTYEEVAFYAYPEGSQPSGTMPVYRFWSPASGLHFYTMSEAQKQYVLDTWPDTWILEGIAWYAYEYFE
jgi:5-carboxymethyl-2-hydroxymuconate isomerase